MCCVVVVVAVANIELIDSLAACCRYQALEKNQQWMAYDQQREAYVQSVVGRTLELEQQLAQVKQQHTQQEANSGGELQGVHKLINRVSSASAIKHWKREKTSD